MALKAKAKHINRLLASIMLVVFAIALTPISIFHNHHLKQTSTCSKGEVKCMHKEHIVNHADNCLLCSLHFEKTYSIHQFSLLVFLKDVKIINYFFEDGACYTQLIRSSLRGPPLA